MQDRDGLSEEQAKRRIASQLTNEDRIEKSHVVLSSFWAPEYTQFQVEKAWVLITRAVTSLKKSKPPKAAVP